MVEARINIQEETNRVINIVKAKHGLKDKSEAIDVLAREYRDFVLEPELRPEYVQEALKIKSEKPIKVGTVNNLRKRLGAN